VGFFLSGINEDRLSESYRNYHPGADFLRIPIWLSGGGDDNVATPQDHDRVKASLERSGFSNVRLERFRGGHQLKTEDVGRALRWFRDVAKF
jgi:predicted esterase